MQGQMNVPPGMAMALNDQARLMAAQGQFKPVTSAGNPTVAAKNLAELSQRDAAKQAQTASGIEAMKQAQMQQALQQILAKQSAPPVPLASGIGSLGADVQMAEGGVVGYASQGYVDPQFPQVYENYIEPSTGGLRTGREEEELFGPMKTAKQRELEAVAEELLGPASKQRLAEARPSEPKKVSRPSAAPAPRPSTSQGERKQPVAPVDTGVASLMGPAVPTGSERQFGEAMSAQGRMEIPAERKPGDIAAERAAYYRSQGIDPNFMQARTARLEAQEARDRAEAEARAKLVEGRGMENLISRLARAKGPTGLAALAQAQLGMEPIVAQQRIGDERFAALMRERQREGDRERAAMEDVQRALADGDIARAEKSRDTAFAARNAKNATEAEMRGKYAPQLLQAETAAMQEAGRAKEGALDRASREKVARIGAEARTAGAGERGALTPRDVARLRAQAEKDVDGQLKADPNYVSMKVRDPAKAETYRTRIIDERLKRVLAEEGYGGAAPAPAAGPVYNFADIGKK